MKTLPTLCLFKTVNCGQRVKDLDFGIKDEISKLICLNGKMYRVVFSKSGFSSGRRYYLFVRKIGDALPCLNARVNANDNYLTLIFNAIF